MEDHFFALNRDNKINQGVITDRGVLDGRGVPFNPLQDNRDESSKRRDAWLQETSNNGDLITRSGSEATLKRMQERSLKKQSMVGKRTFSCIS